MTAKQILNQYRGPLSAAAVAQGMTAAARNAERLYKDAKTLLDGHRYPSASSIAILSIEESGKLHLLRGILSADTPDKLKQGWKEYRNHQSKNVHWILGELYIKGARTLEELSPIFDRNSDHPQLLDSVKQLGFYTDCFEAGHWSEPDQSIDAALAKQNVMLAKILLPSRDTSEREMILWQEFVSPHWGGPKMAHGLLLFQEAMYREGLSPHSPEDAAKFIGSLLNES